MSADSGEESQVKKEEWPEFFIRLFPSDVSFALGPTGLSLIHGQVSPDYNSPPGYVIRMALLDIIDIFEVNRKECARLLLEYAKWNIPGTFKPKPGATAAVDPVPGKDWQLESTIVEVRLTSFARLI